MRGSYPEPFFEELIRDHGFKVINRCSGYDGEAYGEGPQLGLQFTTWANQPLQRAGGELGGADIIGKVACR
jgi:hypothetical protein